MREETCMLTTERYSKKNGGVVVDWIMEGVEKANPWQAL